MRLAINVVLLAGICLLGCPAAALDPAQSIAQYKHMKWTVDDGSPAVIIALAQDRGGYLWIGAQDGLYRFDGIAFESILPERQIGSRSSVTAVVGARDGSVWAGYSTGGIARYSNGVLRDA